MEVVQKYIALDINRQHLPLFTPHSIHLLLYSWTADISFDYSQRTHYHLLGLVCIDHYLIHLTNALKII